MLLLLWDRRKGRAIKEGRAWHSDPSPILFYYFVEKSLEGQVTVPLLPVPDVFLKIFSLILLIHVHDVY